MLAHILEISYLVAIITFIAGLKMLGHPRTARRGNIIASVGMGIGAFATLYLYRTESGEHLHNHLWIFAGIAAGTITGYIAAKKVKMTAMPQMVAVFNGTGGGCSAIIGLVEFPFSMEQQASLPGMSAIIASIIVGSVTFSGSMFAYAKLNGDLEKDIRLPYYNLINTALLLVSIGLGICLVFQNIEDALTWAYILTALSLLYGVMFVIPIGGADMPVVISLLNSFSGIAGTFAGFIYGNNMMIITGILVGASGTILSVAMCKAMNRSLTNVIFGAFGGPSAVGTDRFTDKSVKETTTGDTAVLMNYSRSVVMIPGYGLAVAQAQHAMHDLETILEKHGVDVCYAIHPVAGRMPGHMNVLLAEAAVSYDKLVEMDDINPKFPNTDMVLVVGANDVVNPAANTNPGSPIYGMPILEANKARHIIIIKRSMRPGYAGIDNELFYNEKTSMLFGDAKEVITRLVAELKGL